MALTAGLFLLAPGDFCGWWGGGGVTVLFCYTKCARLTGRASAFGVMRFLCLQLLTASPTEAPSGSWGPPASRSSRLRSTLTLTWRPCLKSTWCTRTHRLCKLIPHTCTYICLLQMNIHIDIYCSYTHILCNKVLYKRALLHTTVVMCGYLHYCHLPVSFDQSGPSPLISLINKWKSQEITEINFFPLILMVDLNISLSSWPISAWLYALNCCHTIGWWDNRINKYSRCSWYVFLKCFVIVHYKPLILACFCVILHWFIIKLTGQKGALQGNSSFA